NRRRVHGALLSVYSRCHWPLPRDPHGRGTGPSASAMPNERGPKGAPERTKSRVPHVYMQGELAGFSEGAGRPRVISASYGTQGLGASRSRRRARLSGTLIAERD